MRDLKSSIYPFVAIFLSCFIGGCALNVPSFTIPTLGDPLVSRLVDRGPVAVLPDNPYLAGTMLYNQEVAGSDRLKGFVDTQGTPAALAVERPFFGPLTLTLYYPDRSEYFTAEADGESWIIRGPGAIAPDVMQGQFSSPLKKNRRQPVMPKMPTAEASTRESPAPQGDSVRASLNTSKLSKLENDPIIAALERSRVKSSLPFQSPAPQIKAAPDLAQIRNAAKDSQAELTPKGDLVHYVGDAKESWSTLARWYTDNPKNAGALARINGKKISTRLEAGDELVIPSYLLVTSNRMSEEAAAQLEAAAKTTAPAVE